MLPATRTSFSVSVIVGLVIGGIIGVILDIAGVPAGSAIGAFVGGLGAALLLYAERRRALIVGFVVGLFSFPVELLIYMGVFTLNLYTPPQVPEVTQDVLMIALVVTLIMQIAGGTIGGLLGGIIHHPPPGVVETPRPSTPMSMLPPPPPRPEKYCIQCGAGLAKETVICPACGAKQPA